MSNVIDFSTAKTNKNKLESPEIGTHKWDSVTLLSQALMDRRFPVSFNHWMGFPEDNPQTFQLIPYLETLCSTLIQSGINYRVDDIGLYCTQEHPITEVFTITLSLLDSTGRPIYGDQNSRIAFTVIHSDEVFIDPEKIKNLRAQDDVEFDTTPQVTYSKIRGHRLVRSAVEPLLRVFAAFQPLSKDRSAEYFFDFRENEEVKQYEYTFNGDDDSFCRVILGLQLECLEVMDVEVTEDV